MKRSLFIAIVVLLMAALFVSCNAEKSLEDQLFEVTIDGGARGLSATGTVNTNVDNLYWYYTATKTAGLFRKGETEGLTPVKTSEDLPAKGLTNASLGSFSKGGWNFCFYGYAEADPTTDPVFLQENLAQTISGTTALQLTLERGAAVLDASVSFAGITWKIPVTDAALVGTLTLEVSCPTLETVEYGATPWDATTGIASFSGDYSLVGYTKTEDPILTFSVYNTYTANGTTLRQKVGEDQITLKLVNGIQYTIVNTGNGIALYEDTNDPEAVTIGPITVPQSEIKGFTAESTGAAVVNAAGAKVTFPESALTTTTEHTLSVSTTPRATAEENYQIAGSTAVAAIDIKLDNAASTTFNNLTDELVEIEVTIEAGLPDESVSVQFKDGDTYSSTFTHGADTLNYKKSYNPSNGKLTIQTNHFSEYVAVIDCVAKIGDKAYGSLAAAVAAVPNDGTETTIKLLKDVSGTGIGLFNSKNATNKNIVIDLCNHTYTLSGGAVGSTGTESQAWHLEKGNTVTIKNGTLTSTATSGVLMLVQNYCNLTLENVTLDGRNIPGSGQYVLSNNCGNVNLTGNTSIIAKAGDFAFDVCGYASYAGVTVTVDTTGTITGNIETSRSSGNTGIVKLVINNGTFVNGGQNKQLITMRGKDAEVVIKGGSFEAKYYCIALFQETKLTIEGGTFAVAEDGMVITGNGSESGNNCGKDTLINISGGTFIAGTPNSTDNTCCIYHPQKGILNISGGTFTATDGVGILMRGGELNISGSTTFATSGTSVGKIADATSPKITSGYDIVIDKQCAYYDSANIVVTGADNLKVYNFPAAE